MPILQELPDDRLEFHDDGRFIDSVDVNDKSPQVLHYASTALNQIEAFAKQLDAEVTEMKSLVDKDRRPVDTPLPQTWRVLPPYHNILRSHGRDVVIRCAGTVNRTINLMFTAIHCSA